jgi:NDP-sugar pyrophosphorylase family protein
LASYAIRWLKEGGIGAATVCANIGSRALRARLASQTPPGMELTFQEDPTPRGPAGCVRDAWSGSDAETVVVVDGTTIPVVDLQAVLDAHFKTGAAMTVVVDETPTACATCRSRWCANCSGPLPSQVGRPGVQTPSGVYVFDRRAFDLVPERGFLDIKENLIPKLYEAGELVATFGVPAATPRVINASTYLSVNQWTVEQLAEKGEELPGYFALGDLQAHPTARLALDAVIVGPVLVGPQVRVDSGATIVGPATIGFGATIGAGALVSRSAVWRKSVIGAEAVVDRCVVADQAYVPAKAVLMGTVAAEKAPRSAATPANGRPTSRFANLPSLVRRPIEP